MERNRRVPRKRIFAVGAERTRPADSAGRGGTRSLTRGLIPSPPLISLPSTGTRSTVDEHGAEVAGPLSPRPLLSPLDRPEARRQPASPRRPRSGQESSGGGHGRARRRPGIKRQRPDGHGRAHGGQESSGGGGNQTRRRRDFLSLDPSSPI